MPADLHCHSLFSDGVEPPAALVERAIAAGLDRLALTDHDSLEGIAEAVEAASGRIEIIAGVEFSCSADDEDVHVLGLFLDSTRPLLAKRLGDLRVIRAQRGEKMVERLIEAGAGIDAEMIRRSVGGGAFGRPHVARALIAAGLAADMNDAFRRWLSSGSPGWVAKPRLATREAILWIHESGGIASLAHPVWSPDFESLILRLEVEGLDAVEARHPDHSAEVEGRLRRLAALLRLAVTAGSDYHEPGRGRTVGQCCVNDEELIALEARRNRWAHAGSG